jgi:hypothetical protein
MVLGMNKTSRVKESGFISSLSLFYFILFAVAVGGHE